MITSSKLQIYAKMVAYLTLISVFLATISCDVMDDYIKDQKEFQYDYYDDALIPAKMGDENAKSTSEEPKNLCNLVPPESPMFCRCTDQEMEVTCFIFTQVTPDDLVWDLFGDKSSLVKLRLNSKPEGSLTFIPTYALDHLKNLQNFVVNHGKIGSIKTFALARLSNLAAIDLTNNQIEAVEEKGFAHLHNLVELLLSENFLTVLNARSFVDLPRLRILYLDRNNISEVEEGTFSEMPDLTELEFWGNALTEVNPNSFKGLTKLHHLDLSYNRINQLKKNTFSNMPMLLEINLQHNNIKIIEESTFNGLDHLMRLRLASNQLTSIPDGLFAHLPRLMMLDLKNNQLESLSSNTILTLPNVYNSSAYIHVEGNPFVCNCSIHWMMLLMNTSQLTPLREELATVKCRQDHALISLLQFPWDQLGCNANKPSTTKTTKSTATSYRYQVAAIAPFQPTTSNIPIQQKPTASSQLELEPTNIQTTPSRGVSWTSTIFILISSSALVFYLKIN